MSPEQQKDKFSPEMRILGASLLSMLVILAWVKFFAPKPPANPPEPKLATSAPQNPATTFLDLFQCFSEQFRRRDA